MEYRKEVDGLRAIAVLPVIFFHAGFELFSGGFVGVDIFFVISGYLITMILLKNIAQNEFSIIDFYERRARRILPALFFVMLVCLPFAWIFLLPADMQSFSQSLIAVSLFFSNFLFWHQSGYFDTASDLKPLLHTWSLSVEEQFYIIFPIILLLAYRFFKKSVFLIISSLAIISLVYSEWASTADVASAFFLLPSRAWELLAGSLIAYYYYKNKNHRFPNFVAEAGGWLGLFLIILSMALFDKNTEFPGINALLPVVGAAMVIIFANSNNSIGKVIGNRFFVFFGLLSYSAYLWHQPVFAFSRHFYREEPATWIFCLLIFATLALAYLTWRFIERPFRFPSKFNRAKIFLMSLVFIIIFLFIGSIGHAFKGFEKRFDRVLLGDVGHASYLAQIDLTGEACDNVNFFCRKSKAGESDIVIVGDSHAQHLFVGMSEHMAEKNISLYYADGMPYLDDKNFSEIFEKLKDGKKQKVLLSFYYFGRLNGSQHQFYENLEQVIRMLQENNKEVVLLADIPKFKYSADQCIYEKLHEAKISTCDLSIEDVFKQLDSYDQILKKLAVDFNVQLIDTKIPFFNGRFYRFSKDNVILYRDKHHLNIPGSRLIGEYLKNQLN